MPYTTYSTPHGPAWIAFAGEAVEAMGLPLSDPPPGLVEAAPPASVAILAEALEAYWRAAGDLPRADPELIAAASATTLRREVYTAVTDIPAGATLTYREIAEAIGSPRSARAVGAAMAANRFAPLIPCHRVVGSDGSLRGYAGGLTMKRALLDMEARRGR